MRRDAGEQFFGDEVPDFGGVGHDRAVQCGSERADDAGNVELLQEDAAFAFGRIGDGVDIRSPGNRIGCRNGQAVSSARTDEKYR